MDKKKYIALFITVTLLVLIFHKLNWQELLSTFKLFNFKHIIPIIALYILSLYIRGIRWKTLLLNDKKYSALNLAEIFTVGSLLNSFLPARAGDIYRAYYLGKTRNEKKMKIFGSVIIERTFDGLTVFFILLTAVFLYCKQPWIVRLTYGIGGLFITSLIIFYLSFKYNKINWLCEKGINICRRLPQKFADMLIKVIEKLGEYTNSFIEGLEVLLNVRLSATAFLYSVIIWIIECYITYLIFASFGISLGFIASLFVVSLTSFSTMIPSSSVFLGPYQYAYILALGLFGINKSTTLAISTIHQGILILILIVLGGLLLLKFNTNIATINTEDIKN